MAISQRAIEDLAQCDADVFHGVVLIHVKVAHCFEVQIECTVPCKQLQHVVEKTNASGDLVLTATFDRQRNPNLGFRSLAMQAGFSHTFTSQRFLSSSSTS